MGLVTMGLLALLALGAEGNISCYSCSSIQGSYTLQGQWKSLFGIWPAQSAVCKATPSNRGPCNSYCVSQTFSISAPWNPQLSISGLVRGCADQVLAGAAINPPQPGTCCNQHMASWGATGLVVSMKTCPCKGPMCNGVMSTNMRTCDNPCGHNTCPKGACVPTFDGVSYTCGGVAPTKVPPTANPVGPGWTKAAQMFLTSINVTVDPCQDFYAFACGQWQTRHPIPPHRSSISPFGTLQDSLLSTVGTALQQPMNGSNPWPAAVMSAHGLFQSCINNNLSDPNSAHFIALVKTLGDFPMLNETWSENQLTLWQRSGALSNTFGVSTFITPSIDTNWEHPATHALYLGQTTLTTSAVLYTNPATATNLRNSLFNYMANAIVAVGQAMGVKLNGNQIGNDIVDMIDLEFSIAAEIIPAAKEREYLPQYNPFTVATANARWPNIDWAVFLAAFLQTSSDPGTFYVTEPTFFDKLNTQLGGIDNVNTKRVGRIFQNYIVWRAINSKSDFIMISGFRDAYLKFKQGLEHVEALPPLQQLCTSMVLQSMPFAASRLYIDFHFNKLPGSPRNYIRKMTTNVLASFRQMVANLVWMDSPTKVKAINKVNNLVQNYAFPDWIMNDDKLNAWYAGLTIKSTDNFWVASQKIVTFQQALTLKTLKAPTDRTSFNGPPAIVNAWYQPELNSITFPAGILNPPFFDSTFPDAVNYGAMGIVEGHELTHGFDDQGVQWTGNGTLAPWIDPSSNFGFKSMAQCVINEYSSFCYSNPKLCVNGVQTQGEDIADNGGMKAAFLSLKATELLNGVQPRLPGMEQFSLDQVFFLAYGQLWCENIKPAALQQQILLDPHAPGRVRVIAAIRNFPPFQQAYNCPANSPMSPTKHCTVW